MKMITLIALTIWLMLGGFADAAGIMADVLYSGPEYWISRTEEAGRVLYDEAGLRMLNDGIRSRSPSITTLAAVPEEQGDVSRLVAESAQGSGKYHPAAWKKAASGIFYDEIRYGAAAERLNLRLLPVPVDPSDHYDSLQGTAVDPCEPLIIRGETQDGAWFFVTMRNYSGWVQKNGVMLLDRKQWMAYAEPKQFLTVSSALYRYGGRQIFQLGSHIPLVKSTDDGYEVHMPVRGDAGWMDSVVVIERDDSLHVGSLPCTRENILRSAFSLLGSVYGWGGLDDSVDCSSLVADVYRSVGVELPRDADQQEKAFPLIRSMSGGMDMRMKQLDMLRTGDALFREGHVMLWLGYGTDGMPYLIHACSSYYSGRVKHYLRRVVVSPADFSTYSGSGNIMALRHAGGI